MSAGTADVVGGLLNFKEVCCVTIMYSPLAAQLHSLAFSETHGPAILPEVIKSCYTNPEANMTAAIVDFKADLQLYYNWSQQSVMEPDISPTGHAALPGGRTRETMHNMT